MQVIQLLFIIVCILCIVNAFQHSFLSARTLTQTRTSNLNMMFGMGQKKSGSGKGKSFTIKVDGKVIENVEGPINLRKVLQANKIGMYYVYLYLSIYLCTSCHSSFVVFLRALRASFTYTNLSNLLLSLYIQYRCIPICI